MTSTNTRMCVARAMQAQLPRRGNRRIASDETVIATKKTSKKASQHLQVIVFHSLFLLLISVLLSACSTPAVRFADQAEHMGFEMIRVKGSRFEHVVFVKPRNATKKLHIYLDGDGSPWINRRWIAADPTPRNTLMLNLMYLDAAFSLYLGRPCYHGLNNNPLCSAVLWTDQRYSSSVIESMVKAINDLVDRYQAKQVVLIGHSGGGTLAMLMAERITSISAVVTIAANLDIKAWTSFHGYTALAGSLNPADQKPLSKKIFQLHLIGEKDRNVPADQIKSVVKKQCLAQLKQYKNFDHHCCWENIWFSTMKYVDTQITQRIFLKTYNCSVISTGRIILKE